MAVTTMHALEYAATMAGWNPALVDPNPLKNIDDLYRFIILSRCGVIIQ